MNLPDRIDLVGSKAFFGCKRLKEFWFEGDAPEMGSRVFAGTADGFTIYYQERKKGFTSPTWLGYPSVELEK